MTCRVQGQCTIFWAHLGRFRTSLLRSRVRMWRPDLEGLDLKLVSLEGSLLKGLQT